MTCLLESLVFNWETLASRLHNVPLETQRDQEKRSKEKEEETESSLPNSDSGFASRHQSWLLVREELVMGTDAVRSWLVGCHWALPLVDAAILWRTCPAYSPGHTQTDKHNASRGLCGWCSCHSNTSSRGRASRNSSLVCSSSSPIGGPLLQGQSAWTPTLDRSMQCNSDSHDRWATRAGTATAEWALIQTDCEVSLEGRGWGRGRHWGCRKETHQERALEIPRGMSRGWNGPIELGYWDGMEEVGGTREHHWQTLLGKWWGWSCVHSRACLEWWWLEHGRGEG